MWRFLMDSRYLNFKEVGRTPSGRTAIIEVSNKSGSILGEVKWFGNWRKYCFNTVHGITLDEHCLGDIANYIVEKTRLHKDMV
jgi:hypothetical protein